MDTNTTAVDAEASHTHDDTKPAPPTQQREKHGHPTELSGSEPPCCRDGPQVNKCEYASPAPEQFHPPVITTATQVHDTDDHIASTPRTSPVSLINISHHAPTDAGLEPLAPTVHSFAEETGEQYGTNYEAFTQQFEEHGKLPGSSEGTTLDAHSGPREGENLRGPAEPEQIPLATTVTHVLNYDDSTAVTPPTPPLLVPVSSSAAPHESESVTHTVGQPPTNTQTQDITKNEFLDGQSEDVKPDEAASPARHYDPSGEEYIAPPPPTPPQGSAGQTPAQETKVDDDTAVAPPMPPQLESTTTAAPPATNNASDDDSNHPVMAKIDTSTQQATSDTRPPSIRGIDFLQQEEGEHKHPDNQIDHMMKKKLATRKFENYY